MGPMAEMTKLERITLWGLSKERSAVRTATRVFRLALEKAVLANGGGGILEASLIATASTALRRWIQAEYKLTAGKDSLTVEQWTALADRSLRFKQVVDSTLFKLGLDKLGAKDPWDEVYRLPPAAPPDAPGASGQANGTPGGPGVTSGPSARPEAPQAASGASGQDQPAEGDDDDGADSSEDC
jgi:hypothetical protein